MTAKTITITAKDGGQFNAHVSLPAAGHGPAIILCQEIFGVNHHIREVADFWAEEGYTVIAPDLFWRLEPGIELGYGEDDFQKAYGYYQRFDVDQAIDDIAATVAHARTMDEVGGLNGAKQVGVLGFCLGGKLAFLAAARAGVDAAVGYYGVGLETLTGEADAITCPITLHFGEKDKFSPPAVIEAVTRALAGKPKAKIFVYPGADHAFNNHERPEFDKAASLVAHSRSLECFKAVMGPVYDLVHLWDKHCEYEFATRNVEDTMATMVAEPYVNHIPTMTGGVGYRHLYRFYKHHFIPKTPADTKLVPISRTVGVDRLVDEMLFCFTHDIEIDWMLPGIPPTGRYVEIPLLAVVCFRGDKLYNEHIYWDQASVLVQIGVLDPARVPAIAGVETARKLLDQSLPSNTLMDRWAESEGLDQAAQ